MVLVQGVCLGVAVLERLFDDLGNGHERSIPSIETIRVEDENTT